MYITERRLNLLEDWNKQIKESGLMKKHIASLINVPASTFSTFLAGEKTLDRKKVMRLKIVVDHAIQARRAAEALIK